MNEIRFAVFTDKKLKCSGYGSMAAAMDTAAQIAFAQRVGSRTELYCHNARCYRWELTAEWLNAARGLGKRLPDYEEAVLRGKEMPFVTL